MAQVTTKVLNAEETLLSAVIEKVRKGEYTVELLENGYSLSDKVKVISTEMENTRRVTAHIGDKTFSGKYVRRLERAVEKYLEGPKAKGGKKKVLASESEVENLMAMI